MWIRVYERILELGVAFDLESISCCIRLSVSPLARSFIMIFMISRPPRDDDLYIRRARENDLHMVVEIYE